MSRNPDSQIWASKVASDFPKANHHHGSKIIRSFFSWRKQIIVFALLAYLAFGVWKSRRRNISKQSTIIDLLLREYQQIVQDRVSPQQASWARHHGWSRIPSDEKTDGSSQCSEKNVDCPKKSQATAEKNEHRWLDLSAEVGNLPGLSQDMFDDIEWDRESDIGGYLDEITSSCTTPKALRRPSLIHFKRCWGYIRGLIDNPRCTTRLDSRFRCSGDKNTSLRYYENSGKGFNGISSSEWHARGVEVIKDHFQLDTVNIIIIGAGPVGLALANAIAELQRADPTSPWHADNNNENAHPNIRILLFENRLDTVGSPKVNILGRKKKYRRDWNTDISREFLMDYDTFDPRLVKFMRTIYRVNKQITMPINIIETLFLLSNRDSNTVKMIYDDFRKFRTVLRSVQNAVVFDATGHRLHILQRPTPLFMTEYIPESEYALGRMNDLQISESDLNFLRDRGLPFSVGTFNTGDGIITYPVLPKLSTAYKMQFVKVAGVAYSYGYEGFWSKIVSIRRRTELEPLCSDLFERDEVPKWCLKQFFWDSSSNYRPDIEELLCDYSPGFGTRLLISNLELSQTVVLESLIEKYAKSGEVLNGIPILDIPRNEIALHSDILRKSNVDEVMETVIKNELQFLEKIDNATGINSDKGYDCSISLFEYKPYMYTEPIYYNCFFEDVPIIRLGDSLMTGDSTIATGLTQHFAMVARLSCKLSGIHEHCPIS